MTLTACPTHGAWDPDDDEGPAGVCPTCYQEDALTDNAGHDPDNVEHVIAVAFIVTGGTRSEAEAELTTHLSDLSGQWSTPGEPVAWWIAEDDRRDGSDNGSAVFVHMGRQQEACDLLRARGMA